MVFLGEVRTETTRTTSSLIGGFLQLIAFQVDTLNHLRTVVSTKHFLSLVTFSASFSYAPYVVIFSHETDDC